MNIDLKSLRPNICIYKSIFFCTIETIQCRGLWSLFLTFFDTNQNKQGNSFMAFRKKHQIVNCNIVCAFSIYDKLILTK
jgi:hypothetical protein